MMQILKQQTDLDRFWEKLAATQSALLLLDFDGTLAPFVTERDQASLYPGVRNELLSLMQQDAAQIQIVSGRDCEDLRERLGLEHSPELWGCHGWQRCFRDGRLQVSPLPETARSALQAALELAEAAGSSNRLERKPFSLALHWRGISQQEQRRLQHQVVEPWEKLVADGRLLLLPFDGGVELRCPGVTKGTAVQHMLQELPKGSVIAYLGDDLTDEDAFVALGGDGLKVLVRTDLRATAADLWLRPPEELLWFLRRWQDVREEGMGHDD
jgi:trehalose 6-phosphate phosphatase